MEGIDYGVTLTDHMSGPAQDAAKAVGDLGASIHKTAGHAKESEGILDSLMHHVTKVIEPTEVMKGAFEGAAAGFKEFGSALKEGDAKGMIEGVTESLAGLATLLDLAVPGLGQAASALIKIMGGLVGVTAGLIQEGAELAIEATQGKLAMIDMFAALGGGIKVGEETEEMLSDLSSRIGITKDTLAPFTQAFMAMGIHGKEALEKATTAAISAQAIMGKPEAAQAFESLTKKIQLAGEAGHGLKIPEKGLKSLYEMGIQVDDVAKKMGLSSKDLAAQLKSGTANADRFGEALQDALIEKGAGPLDRMSKSLANMKKMFSQSIEDIFEDLGPAIDPFLDKVHELFDLFSQSETSGQVMKSAVGGAFTYIFEVATSAIEPIEILLLEIAIIGVESATIIKQHWSELQGPLSAVQHIFDGISESLKVISSMLERIGKLDQAWERLKLGASLSTASAHGAGVAQGNSFADGMTQGLVNGVPAVKDAAFSVGDSAVVGSADATQTKSPSRVAFSQGGFFSQGLALGIDSGVPQVTSAADNAGQAAAGGAGLGMKAGDYTPRRGDNRDFPREKGGMSVQGGIHVTIQAPDGITHAAELTETGIALVFERLALSQGVD